MTGFGQEDRLARVRRLFADAIALHRAGHTAGAARLCGEVLELDPGHAGALQLSGFIAAQSGRLDDAVAWYGQALRLKPDDFATLVNLGVALRKQGKPVEATDCFEQARRLKPEHPDVLVNLGLALQAQGRLDEAVARHKEALRLRPDHPETLYRLGNALREQGRLGDAAACYGQALGLKPDDPDVLNNLGVTLREQGKPGEAMERFAQALRLRPHCSETLANQGLVLLAQGHLDDAVAGLEAALRLRPDCPEILVNLSWALQAQGRLDAAAACCAEALGIDPDFAEAHLSEGLVRLLRGDFEGGWRKYQWRWKTARFKGGLRSAGRTLWDGGPVPSGRLLVWGEQGVGDEIMFSGLVPELTRRGFDLVLECDPRLRPLFSRSFPGVEVIARTTALKSAVPEDSGITVQTPGGSLPRHLRSRLEDFRNTTSPYLVADAETRSRFASRYRDRPLVAGLAWFSNNALNGRLRSPGLSSLAPLLAVPGIRWVSLQYGPPDELAAQAGAAGVDILIDRELDQMADIDAFAGQIAALDLVVTIDNSSAHLAAALGKPTWILLPAAPDWRWLLEREDSPWYPTARLFRQPALGDWPSVIGTVVTQLHGLIDGLSVLRP